MNKYAQKPDFDFEKKLSYLASKQVYVITVIVIGQLVWHQFSDSILRFGLLMMVLSGLIDRYFQRRAQNLGARFLETSTEVSDNKVNKYLHDLQVRWFCFALVAMALFGPWLFEQLG